MAEFSLKAGTDGMKFSASSKLLKKKTRSPRSVAEMEVAAFMRRRNISLKSSNVPRLNGFRLFGA